MDNIISSDQTVAIILIKLNKKWTVIFKNLRLLVFIVFLYMNYIFHFLSKLSPNPK